MPINWTMIVIKQNPQVKENQTDELVSYTFDFYFFVAYESQLITKNEYQRREREELKKEKKEARTK